MDDFVELIKILGPAGLVLYLAFLLVRSFLQKQLGEIQLQVSQKNQEVVLPIRLQAYERICLLLERVSVNNLVTRLNNSEYTAKQLQNVLVSEIREEFNHNLSQQVYMSDEAWSKVSNAIESNVSLINEAGESMTAEDHSLSLAKKIFELDMAKESDPIQSALFFVKDEIRSVF